MIITARDHYDRNIENTIDDEVREGTNEISIPDLRIQKKRERESGMRRCRVPCL